jgi:hypothetical protein
MKIGRVLAALPLLAVSHAAWAQQVQVTVGVPPPPPPPTVTVETAPPPPPPQYVQPPPPPYYYGPPRRVVVMAPEGDINRPHFRWAIGATGGPFIGGNVGGAGGLWAQAGVPINRLLGVIYQTHAMIGAVGARTSTGGADVYDMFFGGIWDNEIMADFTFGDVFQLGVGPSFDVFSVNNFTEGFLGVDGRIGVALGHRIWGHRSGFMLGVDIHPTFITDSTFPTTSVVTSVLLTLGGGWW